MLKKHIMKLCIVNWDFFLSDHRVSQIDEVGEGKKGELESS